MLQNNQTALPQVDDLYSFSMSDRSGVDVTEADDDNDTSFSMSGYTRASGRIAIVAFL